MRKRTVQMVGERLVELLGEGPEGDEKRHNQARDLLTMWNNSQYSVTAMLAELINLKYSSEVRPMDGFSIWHKKMGKF